jgi:hypothetical protein
LAKKPKYRRGQVANYLQKQRLLRLGLVGGGSVELPTPIILLSHQSILEDAAAGAEVGHLSVQNGSGTYTFAITGTAGNRFAVDGDTIERGATSLDGESGLSHLITITADNGDDPLIERSFLITILPGAVDPYVPSVAFNDPRNSMYVPLLFQDF